MCMHVHTNACTQPDIRTHPGMDAQGLLFVNGEGRIIALHRKLKIRNEVLGLAV